ncbi:DNA-binding LytR/AlgR family response regulator [Saonia flava]|uniref:DNA-binding LytR/AlgR family response regulator n=1 Tax=Saonia flava TaxID=523696 RepID=A0A846QUK6_9FLAO|nr:LytTR family DNA-binding domain-containing protein [Saonia flava]NJB70897.1 DNA-binding LytR/AlgR family response regulator [Saonia flava]
MVTKLTCAVIDDEPLARQVLEEYIKVIDYLELLFVAENALELNQALDQEAIDLIFLDIEMPFMTGLDFLKIRTNLPMVIITTAYPDYALEGFQFNVLDYLLKPITFNRFFKAVSKANTQHTLRNGTLNSSENTVKEEAYFFVKCENRYEKIYIDKILYVQALQNYVLIHTEEEKYMSLMPLKTIEENLSPKTFIRVHKSYLVSISKIQTLENHELILTQGSHIPISRNFRKTVQSNVLKNKVLKKGANQKDHP